jgi:hypothetical protein
MTKAEELFNKLVKEIPNGKASKMFGAPCIKAANGKSAAMFWKDCIVVKLPGDALKEALSLDGSCLFEPMQGKKMKEWAQIPYDYKDVWKKFATISMNEVKKLKK